MDDREAVRLSFELSETHLMRNASDAVVQGVVLTRIDLDVAGLVVECPVVGLHSIPSMIAYDVAQPFMIVRATMVVISKPRALRVWTLLLQMDRGSNTAALRMMEYTRYIIRP